MEDIKNRKYVARLVYAVLTERKTAREAILLFPETKDKSIECAYHALVHFEADEDLIIAKNRMTIWNLLHRLLQKENLCRGI